ncbi:MAG: IS1634 family transposase [Rhodocyclales bacterium]|nr:IS1634 family transposase [Rhodocyclales bacterium]
MFLRESRQKRADGSVLTNLQFAESTWNPQKRRSETKIVYNWGRSDDPAVAERLRRLARSILRRCAPEEIVREVPTWTLLDAWPHGEVYVLEQLWRRLGIGEEITRLAGSRKFDFPLERALFAMVANRACAPCSKLYCYEQWLREDVRITGAEGLALQHLYRVMDFLDGCREELEKAVYFRLASLLNLDVEIVFYDTTSLHFEVDEEDGEQDGAPGLRQRGHAKNRRNDVPQIVVGLAVTREGFPVRHWIFPGNTVDVTTVRQVKEDLRGWHLTRCVFVGDAGMVSAENLKTLALGGGKHIVCVPMRRGDEVTEEVLGRAGRYQEVAENLRVKQVVVGDGERRRRYVVCHNPQEEKRQREHRERILAELEAELASLQDTQGEGHSKRACALRTSARYGRYLTMGRGERLRIDPAAVRDEERFDGKFVVHSNDDTLTSEDLALGYKQLQRVEEAWRTLKTGLRLRPVYHWAPHRIRAHVALTVLSLLLERVAEHACRDTWRNIRDDLRQIKLAQLSSPDGEVWQVTEPREAASNRLKQLKINNPPPIFSLA